MVESSSSKKDFVGLTSNTLHIALKRQCSAVFAFLRVTHRKVVAFQQHIQPSSRGGDSLYFIIGKSLLLVSK